MPLTVVVAGVLWGSVSIGPLTPVCKVGTPCSSPAKRATLTFTRPGHTVTTKTDALGHYRLTLPAGTWTVSASVGMRTTPATVVVRTGTHRTNFSIDTGMR